ncbi:MAG: FKBP-type peptidyl-prolyl cis-trans isomerase [Marinifilaceae bacterium]|nr:FKBP-type peptidyl-prolyl cis-trans isomerase [Marinifilaceae bacterium]
MCNKAGNAEASAPALSNKADSISYLIGHDIATKLGSMGIKDFNYAELVNGMKLAANGDTSVFGEMKASQLLQKFFQEAGTKMLAEKLEVNKKWFNENATKDGIVTTESGLQYKVIKSGTGEKPTASDKVKVHYRGTLLLNGKEFDSSYKRNQPAEFGVGRVIAGWTEALQLMTVGSKWELYIPSNLAYGERGVRGGSIGPNDALKFEVELLDIVTTKAEKK